MTGQRRAYRPRDPVASAKILGYVFARPGVPHRIAEVAGATGTLPVTVGSTLKREAGHNGHLRHYDEGGRYGGYIYDGPEIPEPSAERPVNGLPTVGELLMVRVAAVVGGAVLVAEEDGHGRSWVLKVPARIEVSD